ncbi:VOC family protein [Sphingobium lactosutens]|mgnify:CR=1 FL=1|uniref:VOC family protein n=1 Tax=Sphingobium lactosutens TaxID=522773 RepID=UPI0015BCE5EB
MIKVRDIVYVRFQAPDLELGEKFLADFGFIRSAETPGTRYFRCAGENHHAYILQEGDPKFLGFALEVADRSDLEELARIEGASAIESIKEPGGGERVTLEDPDGYLVEVVHGIEKLPPLDMRAPLVLNYAYDKARENATQRPAIGAAQMKRLGHVGLTVTNIQRTIDWYASTLGMLLSDAVLAGPHTAIAFVRCGYPGVLSDHHTLALFQGEQPEFGHAAFEVQDFDAVGIGHYHLKRAEWQHAWGIGRHTLGSQIFDYWLDPWGRMIEHFADGDLFDPDQPSNHHPIETTPIEIWGPPIPPGKGPKDQRPPDV